MNERLCNYAILRFLPYMEIGEFVNVGVAVHCPETGYFDFRLDKRRNRRVRQFFPELKGDVYRSSLEAMERWLRKHRNVEPLLTEGRTQHNADIAKGVAEFTALLTRKEALLHFAEPGTLLAAPDQAVSSLFDCYVNRGFARDQEYQEVIMRGRLAKWLKKWGVRREYEENRVGDDMFHLTLPFVHRDNGRPVKAIKPLDLDRREPTQVYDHGGLWIQRMRRLSARGHMPDRMIFAVKHPTMEERLQAADDVIGDLRKLRIEVVDFDSPDRLRELAAI